MLKAGVFQGTAEQARGCSVGRESVVILPITHCQVIIGGAYLLKSKTSTRTSPAMPSPAGIACWKGTVLTLQVHQP